MNNKIKKVILIFILILLLSTSSYAQKDNPQAEIRNELIMARIYLPDRQTGFYRGTRFDWSAVLSELEYKGHSYFGRWFDTYSPTLHDAIMGPVEEFGPLGYAEADTGGTFVKIGVGALLKPVESKYNKFNYYQIEDHGQWNVKKKSDQITFIHRLDHKDYGYKYTKTVKLARGKPVMEILHSLRNNGTRIIETDVYDHNFFVLDGKYTGPEFIVMFPFDLKVDPQRIGELTEVRDSTISFRREFGNDDRVNLGTVSGFGDDPDDYDITIENRVTGAGVRITGDKPLSKIVFWAASKVVSPEPYIKFRIEPGQEFTWKIIYEFYSMDKGQ